MERAVALIRARAFGYHLGVSLRRGCGFLLALATPLALMLALRPPRQPMLYLGAVFSVFYYLVRADHGLKGKVGPDRERGEEWSCP